MEESMNQPELLLNLLAIKKLIEKGLADEAMEILDRVIAYIEN